MSRIVAAVLSAICLFTLVNAPSADAATVRSVIAKRGGGDNWCC